VVHNVGGMKVYIYNTKLYILLVINIVNHPNLSFELKRNGI